MLLTLSTNSLRKLLKNHGGKLTLLDLPDFAHKQLELRGLSVAAAMLKGWSAEDLDTLRDRADKAACPCLVLVDSTPLAFSSPRAAMLEEAGHRLHMLGRAAHRLGCSSLAIKIAAADSDESFDLIVERIKAAMQPVERLEVNVLLSPNEGLTAAPARLTDLIKRIGGFRIGSLPDFAAAAETGDATEALRMLAPYAGAIHATVGSFAKNGRHSGYDLGVCVRAIRSVGFENTLAIDYVGKSDPVENIERARTQLLKAIEDEEKQES